jgi:hypothetical protein
MQELTQEEQALNLMLQDDNASISWVDVTTKLELNSQKLDEQLQKYEILDAEAQNEALSFYVR